MKDFLKDTFRLLLPNVPVGKAAGTGDGHYEILTKPAAPFEDHKSTLFHRSAFEVLLNNARVSTATYSADTGTGLSCLSAQKRQFVLPPAALQLDGNATLKAQTPLSRQHNMSEDALDGCAADNKGERKERKTSDAGGAKEQDSLAPPVSATTSHRLLQHSPQHDDCSTGMKLANPPPPKKLLGLKANGKLASPKTNVISTSKRSRRAKSIVAVCRYAEHRTSYDVAAAINDILNSPPASLEPGPRSMIVPGTIGSAGIPHPFFTNRDWPGKIETVESKPTRLPSGPPARKESAVTPGKIRSQLANFRAERDATPRSFRRTLGTKSKSVGTEAPWPTREMRHVRGSIVPNLAKHSPHRIAIRKMKYRPSQIERCSVLSKRQQTLYPVQEDHIRPDGFSDPPSTLRIPQKLLMAGPDIRTALLTEMRNKASRLQHPAIGALLESIPKVTTPWDDGSCEYRPWTTKYAPQSASAVLQQGCESQLLVEWLKSLTTSSISRANVKGPRSNQRPKKKRRKKQDGLDDFLVSSDEDNFGELGELEPLESDPANSGDTVPRERTVVRSYAGPVPGKGVHQRIANTVVVSGQHGCGKTAMIYAVARDQGFEVFEINSGSRRSGRDILERVGDMAGNHLVQNRRERESSLSATDEACQNLSASIEADVVGGKQGRMTSFFGKTITAKKPSGAASKKRACETDFPLASASTKTTRQQTQSLILLEEVDVLFEEDKSFWATVLALIESSKRPVVMTCSDENLLPFGALKLHAIIRLSKPSTDLATDYLLCIAAAEGHLIAGEAVETLYKSKGRDLRASINALQLWCQMGVGDPRGGLSWIFQKYPPGLGLGADGLPLRVISKGALLEGMGCLSERADLTFSDCDTTEARAERASEYWSEWAVDPRDVVFDFPKRAGVLDHDDMSEWGHPKHRLGALRRLNSVAQCLSDMDYIAPIGLPRCDRSTSAYSAAQKLNRPRLDLTYPKLSDKGRANHVEGYRLLQTDEALSHADLSQDICAALCVLQANSKNLPLDSDSDLSELRANVSYDASEGAIRLCRSDFAPLDPIGEPAIAAGGPGLAYCSLDGPFSDLAIDIAPYVRSIVRFDMALEEQRDQLSGASSAPLPQSQGTIGKKPRTTRAARSALEGGHRQTTRRERWFTPELDFAGVLGTGGPDWV